MTVDLMLVIGVLIAAYLLGSIPFGYLLVRLFRGEDVRQAGSGNIGATNVARKSPALGMATFALDALKGLLAVEVALMVSEPAGLIVNRTVFENTYPLPALAAIFAILGHMYPVWLRFKGGKGVATGVGVFIALAPMAVGMVLLIFVVVALVSRYVSLASMIASAALPLLAWLLYRYQTGPLVIASMAAVAALIIYKHKENIRRLLAGTESRLDLRRGAKA
jgi:glycerol-3-phosphate acyltransferase PlsY